MPEGNRKRKGNRTSASFRCRRASEKIEFLTTTQESSRPNSSPCLILENLSEVPLSFLDLQRVAKAPLHCYGEGRSGGPPSAPQAPPTSDLSKRLPIVRDVEMPQAIASGPTMLLLLGKGLCGPRLSV